VPLERLPDTTTSPDEIDDPEVLVHRVLYRNGRITGILREDEVKPFEERRHAVVQLLGASRADLHRLEELLAGRLASV
jgi:hypothetical protein